MKRILNVFEIVENDAETVYRVDCPMPTYVYKNGRIKLELENALLCLKYVKSLDDSNIESIEIAESALRALIRNVVVEPLPAICFNLKPLIEGNI